METEAAAAVVDRQVPVPGVVERGAVADGQRTVLDGGDEVGQEAVRIQVGHGAAVAGAAEEARGIAFALRQAAEPVQFAVAGADRAVHPQVGVGGVGVADALGHARRAHAQGVLAGAVGFLAIAVFDAEVDEAVVAEFEAVVQAAVQHGAVAFAGLAGLEEDLGFLGLLLQHDVDDAGDGVGTVLRRGAVAQHFDALDRGDRDGVDVGTGRAAGDGLLHVHQRLLVAALAVDQHQHLIGSEGAQGGRAQDVGAVADGGAREVEAGFQHLQELAQLAGAGALELLAVDHVDRCCGVGGGAVLRAAAEDGDGVELAGGFLIRRRVLGECRQGQRQGNGERDGARGRADAGASGSQFRLGHGASDSVP